MRSASHHACHRGIFAAQRGQANVEMGAFRSHVGDF